MMCLHCGPQNSPGIPFQLELGQPTLAHINGEDALAVMLGAGCCSCVSPGWLG